MVELALAQDVGGIPVTRAQLTARIEAGVTQGVGAALTENLRTAHGRSITPTTSPVTPSDLLDTDIRIVKLVEERDVVAPFGAKAASAVRVVTSRRPSRPPYGRRRARQPSLRSASTAAVVTTVMRTPSRRPTTPSPADPPPRAARYEPAERREAGAEMLFVGVAAVVVVLGGLSSPEPGGSRG